MDFDPYLVSRPLNLNPRDSSLKKPLLQEIPYVVIFQDKITVLSAGKPS
jgi:hypothetical protein